MTTVDFDFGELYTQYHPLILRYFQRRTRDWGHAEDLAQDTFERAIRATQSGLGATVHVSGWLYRIAHNAIVDTYRAHERAFDTVDLNDTADGDDDGREMMEVLVADDLTPHGHVELKEMCAVIHLAIASLPDDQAIVIRRRLEGCDFSEIAAEMGKSIESIKALQHRGFENLFLRLGAYMGRTGNRDVKRTNSVDQVRAYLIANQPMTTREIMAGLHLSKGAVEFALFHHPEHFVRVGSRPWRGTPMNIWGVVGVHDGIEA